MEEASDRAARLVVLASPVLDRRGVPSVAAAERLLACCAAAGPSRVVVVGSSAVHEPNHHHPGLVSETFRPASRFANPVSDAWRGFEAAARQAFPERVALTLLRATTVVTPDGRCVLARLLGRRIPWVAPGFDPSVQLLDVDDLASAIRFVLERRIEGLFHVCPRGAMPLRAALRVAGGRPMPLPLTIRRLARTWHPEGDFLRFPATQSDDALRALGHAPRYDSHEAVSRLRRRAPSSPAASADHDEGTARFDDWGFSPAFVGRVGRTVLRFLRRVWFRAEIVGVDNVPRSGPAVLVGTHRGFVPLDAMVALDAIGRARGRWPRFLVHPGLLRWPYIATIITRLGGVVACRQNAERLLGRGEILGVFPEGLRGPFRLQRDARRVGRFLSDDFVAWAARYGAPIVPFTAIGPAEAFPILGALESRWWRRRTEWPFLPLTPTTPFVPIPLPVKWRMRFLEPLVIEPSAGRSPSARRAIRRQVRSSLQRELDRLYAARRSALLG